MRRKYDYDSFIGKKYGRLTILSFEKRGYKMFAHCKCDCGNEKDVCMSLLINNNTTSCGCKKKEKTTEKNKSNATYNGESKTRLYRCYKSMIYRCNYPSCKDYMYYGKRGIKVCSEWEDYNIFKSWALENGYDDTLTIDRIDTDGDYEPSNCRWITIEEQQKNKRPESIFTHDMPVEYNGVVKTLSEWSDCFDIPYRIVRERYLHGWDIESILNTPIKKRNIILEYKGISDTINNWADRFNLPHSTFKNRLYSNNYDIETIVNKYNMVLSS